MNSPMNITINGKPYGMLFHILAYQVILDMAASPGLASITYFNADQEPTDGTLQPGKGLRIKEGTTITVTPNTEAQA